MSTHLTFPSILEDGLVVFGSLIDHGLKPYTYSSHRPGPGHDDRLVHQPGDITGNHQNKTIKKTWLYKGLLSLRWGCVYNQMVVREPEKGTRKVCC